METFTCALVLLLATALPVWSMPIEPELSAIDIGSLSLLSETINAMLSTMARLSKESQVKEDGHILKPTPNEDVENNNYKTKELYFASRMNSEEALNEAPSEIQNDEPLKTENQIQEESPIESPETIVESFDTESEKTEETLNEEALKVVEILEAIESPNTQSEKADETLKEESAESEESAELQEQSPEISIQSDVQETVAAEPSNIPETPAETEPENTSPLKDNILRVLMSEIGRLATTSNAKLDDYVYLQEMINTLTKESSSPIIEENPESDEETNQEPELEDPLKTLTDIPEDVSSNVEELLGKPESDGKIIDVPETVETEAALEATEADSTPLEEISPVSDEPDSNQEEPLDTETPLEATGDGLLPPVLPPLPIPIVLEESDSKLVEPVEIETPSEDTEADHKPLEEIVPVSDEPDSHQEEPLDTETPLEATGDGLLPPVLPPLPIPNALEESDSKLVEPHEIEIPAEDTEADHTPLEEIFPVSDETDSKEEEPLEIETPLGESDSSFSDSPSENNDEEELNKPAEVNDAPLVLLETAEIETDVENRNREIIDSYMVEPKTNQILYLLKSNANNLKRNIISSSDHRLKAEKNLLDLLSMIAYGASFLAY